GLAHACCAPWRRGRESRGHLLRRRRDGRAAACLALAQAGDRPHPPAACPLRPYRSPDRGRPQIFRQGELGFAGRYAEPAASPRAPDRGAASARGRCRCDGAAAAAYGAVVEPARLRRQTLRPDRRGAGRMNTANGSAAPTSLSPPRLAAALALLL